MSSAAAVVAKPMFDESFVGATTSGLVFVARRMVERRCLMVMHAAAGASKCHAEMYLILIISQAKLQLANESSREGSSSYRGYLADHSTFSLQNWVTKQSSDRQDNSSTGLICNPNCRLIKGTSSTSISTINCYCRNKGRSLPIGGRLGVEHSSQY